MSIDRFARTLLATLLASALVTLSAGTASARQAEGSKKSDDKPAAAPKTADEAIRQGIEAAQKNDIVKAGELFAKAVELDPKNRQALMFHTRVIMMRAGEAEGKKQYELFKEAAGVARKLAAAHKDLNPGEKMLLGMCLYNEACAFSLDNQAEKAMKSLEEAFASGFEDIDQLEKDADLANVRKLEGFAALKKTLVAKAEAAAKEHAAAEFRNAKSFPFDFELESVDGKTVKLADFKGKVTIVDVWGTWCPPCRKEIPHFVDLLKKYESKGLAIVGINYEGGDDKKEEIKKIKDFSKEFGIEYPCVLGDQKTQAKIPDFEGYPTTLFIDRTGKVRLKVVGYHPMAQLEALVQYLLSE
ncbi:MAG: redoxin domain-containing protein [Isosphaeraceae bacterium]|nr:redoxin domain-containing protein [Isosphaeraceae bacterium]